MFCNRSLVITGLFLTLLGGSLCAVGHNRTGRRRATPSHDFVLPTASSVSANDLDNAQAGSSAHAVTRSGGEHVLDESVQRLIDFLASQNDDAISDHLSLYSACELAHFLTVLVATNAEQKIVDYVFIAIAEKITEPLFVQSYDGADLTLPRRYETQLKGIVQLHHLQKVCCLSSTVKMHVLTALNNHEIVVRMPDNVVLVYNMLTQHCVHLPFSEQEATEFITASVDGRVIAVCSERGNLRVWNTSTNAVFTLNKEVDKRVTSIVLTPDGSLLLIGFGSGEIVVWDIAANHCIRMLNVNTPEKTIFSRKVTALTVTTNGCSAFSGDCNGAIYLWDVTTGSWQCVSPPTGRMAEISALRVTDDGHYLVSYLSRGAIQVLDISDSHNIKIFEPRVTLVPHAMTTLGDVCAIIGCDVRKKSLQLVYLNTNTILNDFSFSYGNLQNRIVALNAQGQLFTSSRDGKSITLWGCDIPAVEQLSLTQTLLAIKVRMGLILYQEDQSLAGCKARVYGIISPSTLQLTPQLQSLYDSLPQLTREHIERFAPRSLQATSDEGDATMSEEDKQEPMVCDQFDAQTLVPEYKLC